LFALSRIDGMAVRGADGDAIATAVDAMATSNDGRIAYLVVREGGVGGVGERLHALGWNEVTIGEEGMATRLDAVALARRAELTPGRWPATAAAAGIA
jgi:hypothetical protein